ILSALDAAGSKHLCDTNVAGEVEPKPPFVVGRRRPSPRMPSPHLTWAPHIGNALDRDSKPRMR
ncbi:MAG TPA: hypothetical protein VJQ25_08105, partial [Nitrospira sp.]|nr:hypothetical protein [Nitrospira sp.]